MGGNNRRKWEGFVKELAPIVHRRGASLVEPERKEGRRTSWIRRAHARIYRSFHLVLETSKPDQWRRGNSYLAKTINDVDPMQLGGYCGRFRFGQTAADDHV